MCCCGGIIIFPWFTDEIGGRYFFEISLCINVSMHVYIATASNRQTLSTDNTLGGRQLQESMTGMQLATSSPVLPSHK